MCSRQKFCTKVYVFKAKVLHQSVCLQGKSSAPKYMSSRQKFCTKLYVFKAGLSSKTPDLLDSCKLFKQHAIPNSSLQNVKIYSSKGCRKTSQRRILYVANTAILERRIFSERYHFRLWVFASTGEYCHCRH